MRRAAHLTAVIAVVVAFAWRSAPVLGAELMPRSQASVPVEAELVRTDDEINAPGPASSAHFETLQIDLGELSGEHAEIVGWGIGIFECAGLPLPGGLTFSFHETRGPCAGGAGAYRPATDEISICSSNPSPAVTAARQRRVLVHELAHAWTEHFLTPDRKQEFMTVRGIEAWRSDELRWRERGTEQAADIVAWGLFDRDILFLNIDQKSCEELDVAFRTLTGLVPTAGLEHNCEV